MFKCVISGVWKKNERRISRKKKSKSFGGRILECEILLSSYSLVWLYVNLQVLRKKMEIFKVFCGSGFVPYTRWGAMLWNMAKI